MPGVFEADTNLTKEFLVYPVCFELMKYRSHRHYPYQKIDLNTVVIIPNLLNVLSQANNKILMIESIASGKSISYIS